jgi:hypothetical protein
MTRRAKSSSEPAYPFEELFRPSLRNQAGYLEEANVLNYNALRGFFLERLDRGLQTVV